MTGLSIAVIGGGLAGITAALDCADAGHEVTVFEGRPRLGGLTFSFRRGEIDVDNGQHVFLRCCHAYLGLLERLGVRDDVTVQPRLDIPVRRPGARAARLQRDPLPAPLHLARSLVTYAALSPADRLRMIRAAGALRRLDRHAPGVDERNFGDWLLAHGQNERTLAAVWDLLTVATLNAAPAHVSLAQAAMIFQVGLFTHADAADIGYATVPLQQLHGDAALRAFAAAGVAVKMSAKVTGVTADDRWLVHHSDGRTDTVDRVVLAVPPRSAEVLLPEDSLDLPDGWADGLGRSPIVNVHVLFDRPVLDTPFVAVIDSPIQWIFDRSRPAGIERGRYVAVTLSAATAFVDAPVREVESVILAALREVLPGAAGATVQDLFVTREREATFLPAPGTAALRPPAHTRRPGLALAGAWTSTGWPATMEGAVLSGHAAAAVVLAESSSTTSRRERGSLIR